MGSRKFLGQLIFTKVFLETNEFSKKNFFYVNKLSSTIYIDITK
jgi:hypothetical protein